jgi:hybrid cluster-associated redox disulfide protein
MRGKRKESKKNKAREAKKQGKKEERKIEIGKDTTINELLEKHPELIEFFIQRGHFCIGCPYANETLEEFCLSHGINFKKFKKEIEEFLKK